MLNLISQSEQIFQIFGIPTDAYFGQIISKNCLDQRFTFGSWEIQIPKYLDPDFTKK